MQTAAICTMSKFITSNSIYIIIIIYLKMSSHFFLYNFMLPISCQAVFVYCASTEDHQVGCNMSLRILNSENNNKVWLCLMDYFNIFLKIKPTSCTNFSNLFLEWNSTCFGHFLYPSSGVFHCTHSSGICHTGLLCVQWKTPDDG